MTGTDVVPIGLPVTARRGRVAKTTPSMLSSVLPLRVKVGPTDSFADVIGRTGDAVRAAVGHQRFRVEELKGASSHPGPSVNLLPVIDDLRLGAARGTVHILSTGPVRDLSIVLGDLRSHAVDPVLRLRGRCRAALRAVAAGARRAAAPTSRLAARLPGRHERGLAFADAQGRAGGAARHRPRRSVGRRPGDRPRGRRSVRGTARERRAVVAPDGERSFEELDAESTRLAQSLVRGGVGPGDRVAVRVGRTVHLPALVLGILRAGAAYVPLDPAYPVGRVAHMLEDAGPAALLTTVEQQEAGPGGRRRLDPADPAGRHRDRCLAPSRSVPVHLPRVGPDDLAYVIFTSGSTGRPKGVAVEHGSLHALLEQHRRTLHDPAATRLGRPLRAAHTAGLSFDASWDPLLWLVSGHEIHIVSDEVRRDPERLVAHLAEQRIDALETTPSFAEVLLTADS